MVNPGLHQPWAKIRIALGVLWIRGQLLKLVICQLQLVGQRHKTLLVFIDLSLQLFFLAS